METVHATAGLDAGPRPPGAEPRCVVNHPRREQWPSTLSQFRKPPPWAYAFLPGWAFPPSAILAADRRYPSGHGPLTSTPHKYAEMHIDTIESLERLTEISGNWDAVYEADPEAQFFLSWSWLSKWLEGEKRWFVLAAKPDPDSPEYVAFFPLALEVKTRKGSGFHNNLAMAGHEFTDYTGFICSPDFEDRAIPAFAEHIRHLNWTKLKMPNMSVSDGRFRLFTECFPAEIFDTKVETKRVDGNNIDHSIYPYAKLPRDWEGYLANNLGSNTRQKVRRFLRKIDESEAFRITVADAETFERDLDVLLQFWTTKWGVLKGDSLPAVLAMNRKLISHCFESGLLFFPVLWNGEQPLGALATFVDEKKKSMLFWMAGRDETFKGPPPPGFVLHAYSIRHAIANGFTTYDFLKGNEPYKYTFASEERRPKFMTLRTVNRKNLGGRLDPRSLPTVFDRTFEFHQAGRVAEAKIGYGQILDVEPDHRKALYAMAQLLAADGDHAGAAKTFRTFIALEPEAYKAWFKLGEALVAQREFAEAVEAYREVVKRHPEFIVYKNLGDALLQLGEVEEAVAVFEIALDQEAPELAQKAPEPANLWAGTVEKLAKLPAKDRARHAPAIVNLGDKFRERGENGLAVNCYRQAIAVQPRLITAQLGLGLALQGQKGATVTRLSLSR